ncbi:Protein SPT23 [Smittium culicis]|uniref:Protein SPT23 n=1 Tax=Smittium culicis TaxID=133412 RepID=A0A1R1Y703_9FUNG|nr:Protein SPT23 [Smittium culicis]
MYKSIKGLLGKNRKSTDANIYETEKSKSPGASDLDSSSYNDPRIDSHLIDKMFEKIGESEKFKDQDKQKLYNTLKKIQPRPNLDSSSSEGFINRFTPKLETLGSSSFKGPNQVNESNLSNIIKPEISNGQAPNNHIPSFKEEYPTNSDANLNMDDILSGSNSNNANNPVTINIDTSYLSQSNFTTTDNNNSLFGNNLYSQSLSNSINIPNINYNNPGQNIDFSSLSLNPNELGDPALFNFEDIRNLNFINDTTSEVFSAGSYGSMSAFDSYNSSALSDFSNVGLCAFDTLALEDSNSISSSANGFNQDYQNYDLSLNHANNTFSLNNSPGNFPNNNNSSPSAANPLNSFDQISDAEYSSQLEQLKSEGINLELSGIPHENAKSRVETQVKISLKLVNNNGVPIRKWTHLTLPEMFVSRDKFRHRINKAFAQDLTYPLTEKNNVFLESKVICSSAISHEVSVCLNCIRREYKRSLRKKDVKDLPQNNDANNMSSSKKLQGSKNKSSEQKLTGVLEKDWGEERLEIESKRIVIFNCFDLLDFSNGEIVIPTRITCYCRHHNEKIGFCIIFTLKDYRGEVLSQVVSPPIMITDDHKSTKFKTDRRSLAIPDYKKPNFDQKSNHGSLPRAGEKRLADLMGLSPSLMAIGSGIQVDTSLHNSSPATNNSFSTFATPTDSPNYNRDLISESSLKMFLAERPASLSNRSSARFFSHSHTNSNSSANFFYSNDLSGPYTNNFGCSAKKNDTTSPNISSDLNTIDSGYIKPTSYSLPQNGPIAGGVTVKISGSGFKAGDSVFFNENQALNVFVWSNVLIECVVPPAVKHGPVSVIVTSSSKPDINSILLKENLNSVKSFCTFNYIENTDTQLIELAIHILSLRGKIVNRTSSDVDIVYFLNQIDFAANTKDNSYWETVGSQRSELTGLVETDTSINNDQGFSSLLSDLRKSSATRNLSEMENQLVGLFSHIYSKGELDTFRLSYRHPQNDRNLLHYCSLMGMLKLAQFCISCGTPINATDKSGYTPFHFSCSFGRLGFASFLLSGKFTFLF